MDAVSDATVDDEDDAALLVGSADAELSCLSDVDGVGSDDDRAQALEGPLDRKKSVLEHLQSHGLLGVEE